MVSPSAENDQDPIRVFTITFHVNASSKAIRKFLGALVDRINDTMRSVFLQRAVEGVKAFADVKARE